MYYGKTQLKPLSTASVYRTFLMVPLWHHLSSLHFMSITLRVSQFRFGEFVPVLARSSFITKATGRLIIEIVLITLTPRKRSCGKVMSSQVCVCSGGGRCTHPGRVTSGYMGYYGIRSTSRWYTSSGIFSCSDLVYEECSNAFHVEENVQCIILCSRFMLYSTPK